MAGAAISLGLWLLLHLLGLGAGLTAINPDDAGSLRGVVSALVGGAAPLGGQAAKAVGQGIEAAPTRVLSQTGITADLGVRRRLQAATQAGGVPSRPGRFAVVAWHPHGPNRSH